MRVPWPRRPREDAPEPLKGTGEHVFFDHDGRCEQCKCTWRDVVESAQPTRCGSVKYT